MFKTVFMDRRLWLLGLVLVSVGIMGRWVLPASLGFRMVIEGGYWFTLVLVVLFGRAAWVVVRERFREAPFGRFELWVFAGIIAVICVWGAHDRPGYKILADELLLSGTAMGLHYDREAAYPTRATDIQGPFQIIDHTLDKRPLLFPFVVATVHDLTGYRPENAFYLNMGLAGLFLWLVYLLGWRVGRSRWAGVVAGLLFAGLPLLAQQATGAGFELLNLLLITAVALLMASYLERPDRHRLEALVFGALLLASTRYESVIFLGLAAVAALYGWWRSERVILSWPLIFSPVFLMPVLLQNRIFSGGSGAWEMASKTGVSEPFGVQFLAENLGHALAFFFDSGGYLANSPLFAVMGLVCIPFLGLWVVRVLRKGRFASGDELAWALSGSGLFVVTAVYLLYFWGKFDDPVISRLSLPVHLLMALAVVVIGTLTIKQDRGWKIVALVVLGGVIVHGLPSMAKQAYRSGYAPGVEMQIRADFLNELSDRNVLFLDNDSFFWILQKIPASPITQAQVRKEGLVFHLMNRSFREMYVFQSVLVDHDTGVLTVDPADDLGAEFELELVMERRVQTLLFARISRITAIKTEEGVTLAQPRRLIEPLSEQRTPEELEQARVLYIENWIKQLP